MTRSSTFVKTALVVLVATPLLAATAASAATTTVTKAAPSSLSIQVGKATVAAKHKDTVSGTLTDKKADLSKQKVYLETRTKSSAKYTVLSSATTNAKGRVTFSVSPTAGKHEYVLVYRGTKAHKAVTSSAKSITAAK